MKRILQITSLACGGAESVLMNYYRRLDRNIIDFVFGVCEDEEVFYTKELVGMNADILRLKSAIHIMKNRKIISNFKKTIDAIEIHTENAHSFVWIILAYLCGIKEIYVHSHNTSTKHIIQHKISKIILNLFHITQFACGKEAAKYMYYNYKDTFIVRNAIDTNKFKFDLDRRIEARKKLDLEDKFVIGNVARMTDIKNQIFLVDILQQILKINKMSVLVLVGDGPEKCNVIRHAEELGVMDKVKFIGITSRVEYYMSAFDVFVLPSYFEGLPTVVIEAQGVGMKCFLSNSITKEVNITGRVQFISLKRSACEWAKIISKEKCDLVDTKKLIINHGYDIDYEVKKLENKYQNIKGD